MRRRWICAAVTAACGLSCAAEMGLQPFAGEVGESQGALVETGAPADAPALCDVSDLSWTGGAGSCAGPWEYERWDQCWEALPEGTTAGSEISACTEWGECESWCFGETQSAWRANGTATVTVAQTCNVQCETIAGRRSCRKPTCSQNVPAARTECAARAESAARPLRSGYPSDVRDLVVGRSPSLRRTGSAGTRLDRFECTLQVRVPEPRSGSGSLCGCQTTTHYRPVACEQHSTTGDRLLSTQGLTTAALLAQDPEAYIGQGAAAPACTTCEHLPAGTGDEIRAKFACLCESWGRIPGVENCPGDAPESAIASEPTRASGIRVVGGAVLTGGGLVAHAPNACSNRTSISLPRDEDIEDERGPGAGALDASQRAAFVRHFRLLAELGGEHLPATTRAFIRDLAAELPAATHECVTVVPPEVGASCPEQARIQHQLSRCGHAAQAHVSAEMALIEAPACLALLDVLNEPATDGTCGTPALRAWTRQQTTTLLAKSLRLLEEAPASPFATLPRQLHGLSSWWESFAASHALDAEDDEDDGEEDPRATRSEMLGRFWRHATEGHAILSDLRDELDAGGTSVELEAALELAHARGVALDQAVLRAGLTPLASLPPISEDTALVLPELPVGESPLRGVPLLALTHDAFSRAEARLDTLVELHDFACRFDAEQCRGPSFRSPALRWVRLLGSLGTPALAEELAASTDGLEGWRDVFVAAHAGRDAIEGALVEHGAADFGEVGPGAEPSLAGLSSMVQGQRARAERFAQDGLFDASARRALLGGVTPLEGASILGRMTNRVSQVAAEQSSYSASLDTLARGLVDAAGTAQSRAQLRARMEELFHRVDQLRADERGLLESAAVERLRLGDMTAELAALDEGESFPVGDTLLLQPTGADAMWADQPDPTAAEVSFASLTGDAMEGVRILSIASDPSAQYSPTCALRGGQALVPGPGGAPTPTVLPWEGALTGPEGFILTFADGQVDATSSGQSWEDSHSRSSTQRLERCTTMSISPDAILQGLQVYSAFSVGISSRDCDIDQETYASSDSRSGSQTTSRSARSSAAYTAALKLDRTPVPFAPAGGLLVAILPRGEARLAQAHDIHVVAAPHSTIVVPEESDVYFLVNDLDCEEQDTTRALTVRVRPMATAGSLAPAIVRAMSRTIESASSLREALVEQGTVLSHQLQAVRSTSIAQLEQDTGVAYQALPAPLQTLFAAHLDLALVDLERHVQIDAIRRQLRIAYMQLETLHDELRHVERRGRLAMVLPLRHLHALPQRHMAAQLEDLLSDTERFLLPVMDLWFPESVATPGGAALEQAVEDLTGAGLGTSFDLLVERILVVLDDALARLTTAQAWNRPYNEHARLALTWPRPGATGQSSTFRRASVMPSEALQQTGGVDPWIAVRDAGTGVFRIRPEDLYSRALGVSGVLWCHEAVPVISGMALFVGRPGASSSVNDALNQQGRSVAGWMTSMSFQTETALESYEILSPVAERFSLPLIFGQPSQAFEIFDRFFPAETRHPGPVGMSPFADFVLDFRGLAEARANSADNDGFTRMAGSARSFEASEMTLVMRVDAREVGSPVAGVRRCLPPANPAPSSGDGDGDGDGAPGLPI